MTDTEPQEETLKIRVDGVEYPFPAFDTLSYREARTIKKATGLVIGQFFNALEQGDPDALIAIALIAKLRDNPTFKVDDIYDLKLDEIEIVTPPAPEEDMTSPLAGEPDAHAAQSSKESPSSERERLPI